MALVEPHAGYTYLDKQTALPRPLLNDTPHRKSQGNPGTNKPAEKTMYVEKQGKKMGPCRRNRYHPEIIQVSCTPVSNDMTRVRESGPVPVGLWPGAYRWRMENLSYADRVRKLYGNPGWLCLGELRSPRPSQHLQRPRLWAQSANLSNRTNGLFVASRSVTSTNRTG